MPIMATRDRSDARGSARVLARTAMKCLDEEIQPLRHKVALNSLFRLVKAYTCHHFVGYEYEPRSAQGTEALTLMPAGESHVRELAHALKLALQKAYPQKAEADASSSIEAVIRSMAIPNSGITPSPEEKDRVRQFLCSFSEHLQA